MPLLESSQTLSCFRSAAMVWCLITFLAALFPLLWLWINYHFSYWQRRGVPHNEPKIPAGNMHEWMHSKHFVQIFRETYAKFKGTGPFAGFYFHMQRAVLVTDPELAKNILIKDFTTFDRRGLFHNTRDDPLTGNLFSLDGPKWKRLRTKLSPTFTSGKMKIMYPTVVRVGEELQKVFLNVVGENESRQMELTEILGRFTADVIGECAFGLECNSLKDPTAEFCEMGRKFFTQRRHNRIAEGLIHAFPELAQKLRMQIIPEEVHNFYMGIVRNTIEYREREQVKRCDFMDMLIELKNQVHEKEGEEQFTIEELAAQAFVFFVAGFDTSSTTMSYALYELAQNLGIQDKLRQEICEVLEKHQQNFSYECMKDMVYLDQVISETLRKYPVAPALFRKSTARYETSNPRYYIEKGTMVIIPSESYHHDAEYFPQPEKFDPERFSPMNVKNIRSCTYLPFGDGPRNCIGMRFGRMQASVGLVQLLRMFRFELCDATKIPVDFVIPSFNLNPLGV
ncbi:cytochrome P450 6a2 [Musca domestica]|uniref:Cytochrome P450 6a2 n=1 Tax=Musca domestica TaxID=7370 RepID=A0ABM2BHW5_MUSDO|nr:cytochrome P450 6a2 [Musca domestica]